MINMIHPYNQLPCSLKFSEPIVLEIASKLLSFLEIEASIKLIVDDPAEILNLERSFRLKWWALKDDIVKQKMHNIGMKLDIASSGSAELKKQLTNAWQEANDIGNSMDWRKAMHKLSGEIHSLTYAQYFFRNAQQCLSRAIRWNAVFDASGTPYFYVYSLLCYGVLPIGVYNEILFLAKPTKPQTQQKNTHVFEKNMAIPDNTNRKAKNIFISYEFRHVASIKEILSAMADSNFVFDFGPVESYIIPIEHQILERINASAVLLVFVNDYDCDFGLPIWIYQEIDIAKSLGKPIIAILNNSYSIPCLEGISVFNANSYSTNMLADEILKTIMSYESDSGCLERSIRGKAEDFE